LNGAKDMIDSLIEFFKSAIAEQVVGDPVWATIALIGQLVFGSRFVLQLIASEYRRKSYVPVGFWYLSLCGSVMLLSYSVHIKNPIFMLAFSVNTLIYLRNLHLIHREARAKSTAQV
jgi:lipid-A-disaccharide synthase-like uncharacterized protein